MNKKKILSIMLSFVMTMSVLGSFGRTILADTTDPGNPDSVKQEEQEPEKQEEEKQPEQDSQQQEPEAQQPEKDPQQQPGQEPEDDKSQQDAGPKRGAGAKSAPEIDISAWPEASFTISPEPYYFDHGGYLDVNCEFSGSGILFGRVGEKVLTQELELNISRTAKIYKANGDEVGSVEVTNDKYNLSTGSKLVVTRSLGADQNAPFTFAVNVPSSIYHNLDDGAYTVAVEYQATWKKNIDYSAGEGQLTDDQTLPAKTITLKLYKYDSFEEGNLGNGLYWEFNYKYSRLTIYGAGAMPDYDSTTLSHRPWDYFKDKINIILIQNGITSVGDYAFSGCTSATQLKFQNYSGLKTIGKRAFEGCGITSLELPEGVTSIGEAAFQSCNKIEGEVSIPYTVTSIGDAAFGFCGFSDIYLPNNLTGIGKNMFANCYNLSFVSIPYTVKTIGDSAFTGCSSLTYVSIPEYVTSIERCAFMNSGITSISIPDGVTKISSQTFYGCNDLTSVTIPSSVTSIESSAFSGCSKLETITIPVSVTSISSGAFSGCDKLGTVYCQADPDKLTWGASSNDFISNNGTKCYVASRFISKFKEKFSGLNVDFEGKTFASGTCGDNVNWTLDGDGTLFISGTGPMYDYTASYDGRAPWNNNYANTITGIVISDGITTVGNYAFDYCRKAASVSLPDSIKSIGVRAFNETASLKSIELPSNLESIGDYAFCVSMIRSITIPDSVTTIGEGAFLSAYNMKSVTLGNNVKTIGSEAFENTIIESIVIPSSVTSIGYQAFYSCSKLASVTLSDGLESIGDQAFLYCSSLKSITIPGSVQTMGTQVFNYCNSLTTATICEGVTVIPDGTFQNCNNLKNVTISDTVTSIGEDAFRVEYYNEPDSIESIVIPNSVTSIASGAFYGQQLRSITIPGSVKTISATAFRYCEDLETVIILDGVSTIENYTFEGCKNIKTISVPSTVTSLGSDSFGPGQNLTDIYSYTDPSVWISFSYGVKYTADTKLHVPENKVGAYRSTLNPDSTLISETNLIGDAEGQGTVDIGTGVHLYGYTLSLQDYIGVNFWFKLDEGYNAGDNYILFTVNGNTQKVKVNQAENGTDGAKIFPCGVVAKEMTDVITARFYLADGTAAGSEYTYTVRDYANYILSHQSSYSGNTVKLVKAILNYGAATQIYFNYKTNALANSALDAADQNVNILTPDDIVYKNVSPGYVAPAKVSLVLNDTISLKLYFHKADVQDLVIKSNRKITITESGDYTIVKIDGITPTEFISAVGLEFYDADNRLLGNLEYSPVKYCKLILNQPTGPVYTDDLKRAVSALYKYCEATKIYVQHPNQ